MMTLLDQPKAALRGEPSYVWRAGQERRLRLIVEAAGERIRGDVLVDGCGVGAYAGRLAKHSEQPAPHERSECKGSEEAAPRAGRVVGLDIEFERLVEAARHVERRVCGASEVLPFPNGSFDLVLSHEVLEHVQDDRQAVCEIARVLRPGGRLALFVPNRGYPFETHGIYWRGRYRFGNIPLVNYLPRGLRDRLAPHVRVYSAADLGRLFAGLPLRRVHGTLVFGAYDNIIARRPALGKALRSALQALEHTPLKVLGLSHFWVLEKS